MDTKLNNLNLLDVQKALEASWGADTAQSEKYSDTNVAAGQCAVSSLIIQELFGGFLLRGITNKGTVHYWNDLGGAWFDSTRSQFEPDEYIVEWELADEKLYWFEETKQKYRLLFDRVAERLL